ncbi:MULTISPECIES: D-glycero-beta-D-manno-heptose 1-phosphate adenylyltransferase [Streptomyces]|uniref:D-glycero-beta-D-manno-heptose 1-phosphate adenylyltransferase n=1 Tax=Streptomyces TaxID=1883 RepID=UPI0013194834|nr:MULTISPECIES: D-glycero-beta-D-manno-heptose 1-phosphate adenylyltransferase [Streptomyces]QGZ47698.1 D-glycero-beta-D-manno-heptose 1-phosphate adenylyltransferase [Streptomyces sp. QHH-9511]GGT93760.1 bifunctional protein HldE [Streptomyces lateritius]
MNEDGPLVVVGDVLLDQDVEGHASRLAPDAPVPVVDVAQERARPGGAGLAAALAARHRRPVVLVTALGRDPASETVRRALRGRVSLVEIPLEGTLPVKTRVLAGGRPLVRVDRGDGTPGKPGARALDALAAARAVLVADYGRGTADALRPALAAAAARVPLVWDPHPRGGPPVAGARLVTPNAAEAAALSALVGGSLGAHARRGADLAERWAAGSVVVTLGERGALLTRPGAAPVLVPAPFTAGGDPCGAGDCFAAASAAALAEGALPEEAVTRAVAESAAFVRAGGAGNRELWEPATVPRDERPLPSDALHLAREIHARGGTVVATGGCFDLLHAGHVGLLENAGRIGDCLIVCVNSDASVTRLKGPGRPLTPLADRVRVLSALDSVDAVAVFDEETPVRLLESLRPDVWVKGGDYAVEELPEAEVLRKWGGQAVVLPYLDGRSTTSLAHRAAKAAVPPPPAR